MLDIAIELTKNPKPKPQNESKLAFGTIFTDHMFIMDYSVEKGWHDPRVVPYQNLSINPAAMCLHYSQEVFEGLKAYRTPEGKIQMFRVDENYKRLNKSNKRMCIPELDEEFCIEATKKLIAIEKNWVPSAENTSLYIRPFVIATDPHIGVRTSHQYMFIIILSPVGTYYPEGLNPTRIRIEDKFARTVRGGTGTAKTGGNYAASLLAQEIAEAEGYSQVLWLDSFEHKYIDEVGSMNVFFIINNKVITPNLNGAILDGITRKSSITVLKSWGYEVEERPITIDEIVQAHKNGTLQEIFGTGTAAVISPVGFLKYENEELVINNGEIGEISQRLYDEMTGIQWGRKEDKFQWVFPVI